MSKIPSVILVFGEKYLSKNLIVSAKKKFNDYKFETLSVSKSTYDDIRADVGTYDWSDNKKVFIIEDFPNNNDTRKFLLDLCNNISEDVSLILFDTLNSIKVDSNTHKPSKTWQDFITELSKMSDSKVINNGPDYTEKDGADCVSFIRKVCEKNNRKIEGKEANLLMKIVGIDKGILISEIEKLALISDEYMGYNFILENAYPVTEEAVLYKFANALDSCSPHKIFSSVEEFIHMGTHPNVLAEIMMKKARWQLAASYFYSQKMSWNIIVDRLMEMGEFPSLIWHDETKTLDEKKEYAQDYQDLEGVAEFMIRKQGIPQNYVKSAEVKPKTLKSGKVSKAKPKLQKSKFEKIPMRFMVSQVTAFLRDHVVRNNGSHPNLKDAVLQRAIKIYLMAHKKLVEIRTSDDPKQPLIEMGLALIDTKI